MPAIQPPALCVLLALPEEAAALLPRMRFADPIPALPDLLNGHVAGTLNGRTLSVTCSGMGAGQVAPHLEFLFAMAQGTYRSPRLARENHVEPLPIRRLLIGGFAGGLAPSLQPGDLVLADRVIQDAQPDEAPLQFLPDPDLLARAHSVRRSIRRYPGTLVTVSHILMRSAQKRAYHQRTGATAVDMETATAAQMAQSRNIPWLAVRAISDTARDNLPFDFSALSDASGHIPRHRVLGAALTRPWKIPGLIRLGMRSALAARNLADFVEAFLATLPEAET
ncbi:MAG: hypothetical protein RMJ43_01875 [Chloroherpetonaceae bacterium]|nr:hypothetical protein [Chthonomonadaceae bacterium]MDW8206556.1 hypothetical protein [Chloroherpetonaceae bacterium]